MGVSIIEVTPATAGLLGNVDPDVFDHEIEPARVAAYVAAPLHAMFVATDGDLVVGQIRGSVHLQPDRAPISTSTISAQRRPTSDAASRRR